MPLLIVVDCLLQLFCDQMPNIVTRAYERGGGGSAGTSVRGPETQEGPRESLKNPKALAIDVLF